MKLTIEQAKRLVNIHNDLGDLLDQIEERVGDDTPMERPAPSTEMMMEALASKPDAGGPLHPTSENFMRSVPVAATAGNFVGNCRQRGCGTLITDLAKEVDGGYLCPRCGEPFKG